VALLGLGGGLLAACASGPKVHTTSPFTETDAEAFAGSVDFVGNPRSLQGRWQDAYAAELERRVERLDLLAVVQIHTLRNDLDPERRSKYRLLARVERTLFESDDFDVDELELAVRDGEAGYPTVADNQARILDQPFLAFVKFAPGDSPGAAPVPRWHLSPLTEPVLERVRPLLQERDPGALPNTKTRRVYVHDN